MKRLTAVIILGLASLFAVRPAIAQSLETTASEVVDRETLKAFVEGAMAQLSLIDDLNTLMQFAPNLSIEGDWKHGNMYLIVLTSDGTVLYHGNDASMQGPNLSSVKDDRGNAVVQDLIAAASMGGGYVEYYWDDPAQEGDEDTPKIAYATSNATTLVLIGGYYQDVSQVSTPTLDLSLILPHEITAAEVVDRETLKVFVKSTTRIFLYLVEQVGISGTAKYQDIFREDGGPWRQGSIYFFIFTTDGYVFFHGADDSFQTQNVIDLEDINGVKFIQELIKVAKAGGDFVEYYFDDPAVIGDEDTGSPKISYAELITFNGLEIVVGSGFYKKDVQDTTAVNNPNLSVLNITLTQNDQPVADAKIEFSRSIAGRAPEYQWQGTTNAEGRATIEIQSDSGVSGYYLARTKDTSGNTLATWGSIPINGGEAITLSLPIGGRAATWGSIPINGGEAITLSLPIGGRAQMPMQDLVLHPNVPNPFNPSTQIAYQIPDAGHVALTIYNTLGQQVRVLVQDSQASGQYRVTWDGKDMYGREVSSGVYIYRLVHSSGVITRQLLLVK